ncbi:galactose-1-epimerase [Vibrio sp. 10N.286.49.B3]|uniref:galactose-1-epimerase n=1 Tax=Vibrio sp. 10N.286.49.B3 TaxID=1880855 RepID=UPI000C867AC5|nr:galactose-1-epimerase [Vibrio sp. 10N.286.49.B3]PMH44623.1 galactose-1-epimerase [Vibrio sp. 10N.286.49.B3]
MENIDKIQSPLFTTMRQGVATDGHKANLVQLTNIHGMSVVFMDIGATWLSCRLPMAQQNREVLLGVSTIDDFYQQKCYLGATVGRYANRISAGQFDIDGIAYQVSINQAGNCLHGGVDGFDKRRWEIVKQNTDYVEFKLVSEDGDQGFPGQLVVSVCYELTSDNEVIIRYRGKTDKATPVNLTNHAYFNLLGAESDFDCLDHQLQVKSETYLPVNEVGIPYGELKSVFDTSFDFTKAKEIKTDWLIDEQQKLTNGYDHAFLLVKNEEYAVRLTSPDDKVSLCLITDKPSVQIYTGNWLSGTPNRKGDNYNNYAGIALESQFLPDSPNHINFKQENCILYPDQEYNYTTRYQFDFSGGNENKI